MNIQKVFEKIESLRPEMINTLGDLVACQSFRTPAAEGAPFGVGARACLDRFLEIGRGLGFKTENVDGYAGRVYSTDGESALGILAHLDTVPAGEGWTREPYKISVEDGKIYGRGTMDDKGPAVSVLYAMYALKELGISLPGGVELIVGTDEECGSSDMEYYRSKKSLPPQLFTPDACYPLINIEKGRIAAKFSADCLSETLIGLHGGKTLNAVPALATAAVKLDKSDLITAAKKAGCTANFTFEDGGGAVKITASGVSAHASTPEAGDNALTALIKLLSLCDLGDPANGLIRGLNKIFPYGETDGQSAGVSAKDGVSGALTLVLSVLDLEGGRLTGGIDIRFPVCESVGSVGKKLSAALESIGFAPEINGTEPHCVPSDSPFVKKLLDAYEAVTGLRGEPLAIGGGTYVHGIPGGVAFGCEVEGEDNRIHGADEFISADALVTNAKIFARAIVNVCG